MASKPETTYIASIHKHLDDAVYKEKMNNPFRSGRPDVEYEGPKGVLLVEYKWYPKCPSTIDLTDTKKKPSLSKLQQKWLLRAKKNNRDVAVVAGTPEGGLILEGDLWYSFRIVNKKLLYTRKEVANWIKHHVLI